MRIIVGCIFLFQFFLGYAQHRLIHDHRCRDLIIVVSKDTCNTPAIGTEIFIFRSDSITRNLRTDSLGRIQICECTDPGFFVDGFVYDIEVRSAGDKAILVDQVSTKSTLRPTRAIRDLKFENYCEKEVKPVVKAKIDLNVEISYSEGEPMKNERGIITRDDSVTVQFVTDSLGRFSILNGAQNDFMIPNHTYKIEMPASGYLHSGISDKFNTYGIHQNTRLVRELTLLPVCSISRPAGITFEKDSLALDEYNTWELEWSIDFSKKYDSTLVMLVVIYDDEQEMDKAKERADFVRKQLIESGFPADRVEIEFMHRSKYMEHTEGSIYRNRESVDVVFNFYWLAEKE